MTFIFLVLLVLIAFAANSVLGRMAISWDLMDSLGFGALRLASGAMMLALLCALQRRSLWVSPRAGLFGAAALTIYMIGFCLAYESLDAGLGALVLFGVVQIAMFSVSYVQGSRVALAQVLGAAVAFLGLAFVVWPTGEVAVPPGASFLMALSGLGWAAYTLCGRDAKDPLSSSAMNFLLATLMILPVVWLAGGGTVITAEGCALAVLSGAVTSGLGYALWYHVLPRIEPPVAATIQLSVPVLAILGGAVFLAEPIGLRLLLGTLVVLGGIALVIWFAPRKG